MVSLFVAESCEKALIKLPLCKTDISIANALEIP